MQTVIALTALFFSVLAFSQANPSNLICFDSICKNNGTFISKTQYDQIRNSKVDTTEIAALAAAAESKETDDSIKDFEQALLWLKSGSPKLTDHAQIKIFNLFATLNIDWETKESSPGLYQVDREKTAKKLNIPLNELQKQADIEDEILKITTASELPTTDINSLRKLMSNEEISNLLDKKVSELAKNWGIINSFPQLKVIGDYEKAYGSTALTLARNKGITSNFLETVSSAIRMTKLITSSLNDKKMNELLGSDPIDLAAFAKAKNQELKFIALLKAAQNRKKSGAANSCDYNVIAASTFLPTASQASQIDSVGANVKQEFLTVIQNQLHTSAEVSNKIFTTKFYMQDSKETYLAKLKKDIIDIDRERQTIGDADNLLRAGRNRDFYFAMIMASADDNVEDELETDIEAMCSDKQPLAVPDHYVPNQDFVRLGLTAISQPGDSDGIAFHELGHFLRDSIKKYGNAAEKDWLQKVESCLQTLHKSEDSEKYVSEDFADLIGSLAPKAKNPACYSLIDGSKPNLSITNSNTKDEHSSLFFRAIHIDFLTNKKMAPQCMQAMNHRPLRNCLNVGAGGPRQRSPNQPSTK